MKRAVIVILDSLGIGSAPDSDLYGDSGSNTLGHIAEAVGGLNLPNLEKLGLGNIAPIRGVPPVKNAAACFGKSAFLSKGKDTTTGHWELTGIILPEPFSTYPQGFPPELVHAMEKVTGYQFLGNRPASGVQIIQELGDIHMRTGKPILYTSADSVLQIAAHEAIIPLSELYRICEQIRQMLKPPYVIGRVIARPFIGESGHFIRTSNRRDFSLPPPAGNMLEVIAKSGLPIFGIGKIKDVFAGLYVTESIHTENNQDGMRQMFAALSRQKEGLIFGNLVDFDMVYGHRNNVAGYAQAIKEFDDFLPELLSCIGKEDLLIITADHGNDPTTPSTDHSREYVPILAYCPSLSIGRDLGVRQTLADVGATVLAWLGLSPIAVGQAMLP